jgi:hypothetical protein
MIDLMLQAGGEQPVRLQRLRLAVEILVDDDNPFRPGNLGVMAGQRQAAFLPRRLLAASRSGD